MMLEIRNVKKSFDGLTVLDGISLDVEKGDVVAILGPSGSGKTTFLRCLNFLEKADEGTIVFDGQKADLHSATRTEISSIRKKTAFVFQNYNLIPHQSVLGNVELALTLTGVSKGERQRRAKEVLEKVGLGDQLTKRPNQMSGGQMQRAAIARALMKSPRLMLADEPTGNLDSVTGSGILDLFREFHAEANMTTIMVTHDRNVAKLADRMVELKDGHLA